MDDAVYRNVPLDKALLPDRDNPLLPTQFIPNAAIATFNIVGTDTLTTTDTDVCSAGAGQYGASGNLLGTKAHNLNFNPVVLGYSVVGSYYSNLPQTTYASGGVAQAAWTTIYIGADATNVYVSSNTLAFGATHTVAAGIVVKYYLLKETAVQPR